MNPKYSLRAFANALDLEPSKLSEILSGKKGLSAERAEKICARLRLQGLAKDVFILSVQSQHSRIKKQKDEATKKLKELLLIKNSRRSQTTRNNAWYFGAVKAALAVGLKAERLLKPLGLTSLQIESAERFINRIAKDYPEKERFSYDPLSLIKKVNEDFSVGIARELDAEFLFLSEEQAATLSRLIQNKVIEFSKSNPQENKMNLYMYFNGFSKLCSKEEIC